MNLTLLNFPEKYHFRLRKANNHTEIFCIVRKKWIVLTPEEWVRQNMISYLLSIGIQSHNLAVEYPIAYHGLQHRADIVIFAKSKIQVLIECKKTEQPITQQTIAQVLRYNHVLQLSKTIITNGLEHYYFTLDTTKGWSTLQGLPDAEMLSENYE